MNNQLNFLAIGWKKKLLKSELIQSQFSSSELSQLNALKGIGASWQSDYRQVPAAIINRSPEPWYNRARINRGTDDGVIVNCGGELDPEAGEHARRSLEQLLRRRQKQLGHRSLRLKAHCLISNA